jgi:hypothetical protein
VFTAFEVEPQRVEGLPVLGVDPVADYRPLLEEQGFAIEFYQETRGWAERVQATYTAVIEAMPVLTPPPPVVTKSVGDGMPWFSRLFIASPWPAGRHGQVRDAVLQLDRVRIGHTGAPPPRTRRSQPRRSTSAASCRCRVVRFVPPACRPRPGVPRPPVNPLTPQTRSRRGPGRPVRGSPSAINVTRWAPCSIFERTRWPKLAAP